jgi:hypothetical protein
MTPPPSTEWKERVAPDEEARYARYAEQFTELQARTSAKTGTGRALHRRQVFSFPASLEVLGQLPEHARQGLFATPGVHPTWVRLSNGGAEIKPDPRPDIRGFALKVFDVTGPAALGGEAKSQDFTFINQDVFSLPTADEFVGLAISAGKGPGTLLKHLFGRYGVFGTFGFLKSFSATMSKPFTGFATETMNTPVPLACGPYAIKARLVPAQRDAHPDAKRDWAKDVRERLAKGPLAWDLELQFFVSEEVTPIENPSVRWPEASAPWLKVARLTAAQQTFESDEARAFAQKTEASTFDPWCALAAHRPLGDIQRARKVTYYASQKARGAV